MDCRAWLKGCDKDNVLPTERFERNWKGVEIKMNVEHDTDTAGNNVVHIDKCQKMYIHGDEQTTDQRLNFTRK